MGKLEKRRKGELKVHVVEECRAKGEVRGGELGKCRGNR